MTNAPKHHRRRHHARRNPPILRYTVELVKGGALTYGGRIVNKKVAGFVQSHLPTPSTPGATAATLLGVRLATTIAVALAARQFAPKLAAEIANGAMAETIEQGVLMTPAAPYLSSYLPRRVSSYAPANRVRGTGSYRQIRGGTGGRKVPLRTAVSNV